MSAIPDISLAADAIQALTEMRPRLHRYCARMVGSAIDGEDLVQETVVKAIEAIGAGTRVSHIEGWLIRIAHNTCLDFLRRRARAEVTGMQDESERAADAPTPEEQLAATASLHMFMRLPVLQRSAVILMDVLGCSMQEIAEATTSSVAAVKAALVRGRAKLQRLALEMHQDEHVPLSEQERSRLAKYVELFNARDFDAIRRLLGDEVKLDLVGKLQANGIKAVANYFHNYSGKYDWRLVPGVVDGQLAALVCDPLGELPAPEYFILLRWSGEKLVAIRDFRYARYATRSAMIATC